MTNGKKLTLPIQVGKRYVRRDGAVATIAAIRGRLVKFEGNADNEWSVYVHNGRAFEFEEQTTDCDLVADYVEPAAAEPPQGHMHAANMALYAQDAAETEKPWERWQYRRRALWASATEHPSWHPSIEYRRKPKTIRIGNIDVPEPLRTAPASCIDVFLANPSGLDADLHLRIAYTGSRYHVQLLQRGLIHATREAAEQHAKALLSFTEAQP